MKPNLLLLSLGLVLVVARSPRAADLPLVRGVERQPLAAQAQRVVDALDFLGAPLSTAEKTTLRQALANQDATAAVLAIQQIFDPHCLAGVRIDADNQLEVRPGPVAVSLAEQGWRVFLVKVDNVAAVAGMELRADSPNSVAVFKRSTGSPAPTVVSMGEVSKRFLELDMFSAQPLVRELSGLELEYRIIQIYCRDAGRKEAQLGFSLWPLPLSKSQPKAPRCRGNLIPIAVDSAPAVVVRLQVLDHDGKPTTAAFTITDSQNRVYPSLSRRLAPDFGFHSQIYRRDGESVVLQPGSYTVRWTRGPEYVEQQRTITVPSTGSPREMFRLQRWVHPAARGWYSGDHHVHAAGCAHYESPTEGVTPEDMMRHVLGEDLNVGCVLSWGPCWYHQKRYFEGRPHALSTAAHLLRYDVEVSGFPSSHCGHICLLRLREQDYPGTKLLTDWPSWDLPIFRWAKSQGAVVGFAHSGWGLEVDPREPLPNFVIPPMSGIGANEFLVDVAHDQCDFISTVDTPAPWELNIWYHTLNCGYRCRVSGETDFPCIYGERVGLGRSYVHLKGPLQFDDWVEGIKRGHCYVSDGKSHLMDFSVNDVAVGTAGSEVRLDRPGKVKVTASVAALLPPEPTPEGDRIRAQPLTVKPYWDLQRARIGRTRKVPVELVVNGYPVAQKEIIADGTERQVTFDVSLSGSSWVCLRIFPSSHTNPVFVLVEGKPIRTSRRSVEWCLRAIDRCWERKKANIRAAERGDAEVAYEKARQVYRAILAECQVD